MEAVKTLDNLHVSDKSSFDVKTLVDSFYKAMNDDFNTPVLIANLFEAVRLINSVNDGKEQVSQIDKDSLQKAVKAFTFDVLGLHKTVQEAGNNQVFDKTIQLLIDIRNQARTDKNWDLSDKIRDELANFGVQLKDGKDGTVYTFK